ncbi:flagellar hook protein FlgE [Novimethylophilus kurashikiensis]|uniref:Flagellar hook protein FlgE n=1 Tax=Novimethylophilus kurashikiensis TaxID=1825523 RepID=A0A2R5FCU0_9PROT|nr:flagellar hook protein FlgE [Novimethylophilus kurashikiensis]GBG15825.1 flagellar hook protein FlgE [Novimethylophilus kurashikiensis]
MGFQQALSGLNVASKDLDVIGHNVANSSTVGFKSGEAQFADVFAASLVGAGASPVGLGAKLATVVQQFTQGNVTTTNNPLDVAINGGGFYRVSNGGAVTYTRNGQFELDKNGFIVTSTGQNLTGYAVTPSGLINTGALTNLQVNTASISPQVTGGATSGAKGIQALLNLDSSAPINTSTFDYTDPTTYTKSTSLTVYDTLGSAHTYSMYFVKTASNTWQVNTTLTNPAGVTTDLSAGGTAPLTTLTFDTAGVLTAAMPATQATIPDATVLQTGAADLTFPVDFTGTTQFGGSFSVNSLTQDGYGMGQLSGFSISKDGIIQGRYTNGQSKNLGQVVLTSFRNPQGLQPLGDNQWAETSTSGIPLIGTPGSSGSFGALQSSAVEDSNVDLTGELVNMITAQRNYQANAQTIKTQDQVMQTLVNLR